MECPTCGQQFSTEQGMRQHHTKVHDRPLPNRTCKGCESEFYDPKARRSYCNSCNPNAGEHNGNWKDARETATCTRCGATFSYYPSSKAGVYCSDCVEAAPGLLPENYSEPGERVTVPCRFCETELEVRPARLENQTRGVFCTLECYGGWLSENVVGPEHHHDYECQYCGVDRKELGRNPDVHHVRPVRSFERPGDAHTMNNVITLCRSCHRRAEEGEISVAARHEK